jgi:outer membrane immunogenic protein
MISKDFKPPKGSFGKANNVLLNTDFDVFTVLHRDHLTENVGRIGVNYRWGGPVVARY